jgi:hypothetical protein
MLVRLAFLLSRIFGLLFSVQNQAQYTKKRVRSHVPYASCLAQGHAVLSFQGGIDRFYLWPLVILAFLLFWPVGSKLLIYPQQDIDVSLLVCSIRNHRRVNNVCEFAVAVLACPTDSVSVSARSY